MLLNHRGPERHRTSEDIVELVRKLAEHSSDEQTAAILNKQGRRTGTGLVFDQSRVKHVRQKHGIPAAPPPDPDSDLFTIRQAAAALGVTPPTIYRWLTAGLLPGEQTTPHAPWRIRITDEIRARFVADVPAGYMPLDEAAKRLGCARQGSSARSLAHPPDSRTDRRTRLGQVEVGRRDRRRDRSLMRYSCRWTDSISLTRS